MLPLILWFFVIFLLGWAIFPFVFQIFPHLTDRGYGLIKPAGLLVFGYLYWILTSFQVLPNNWNGVAGAFILVFILGGVFASQTGWIKLKDWITQNIRLVVFQEVLFLVLFLFIAFMRASNPEIIGTEKPMELAFINAILRSPTFPPNDPWLSGYAISYYYFGYVMVAGLIRLTGTISGVGFNLAIALWFAMAGAGSFSLVLNMIVGLPQVSNKGTAQDPIWKKAGWAVLGPVLLIFTANWEGLLEILHSMGLFWKQVGGTWLSPFWSWLDIQELTSPPSLPFSMIPERASGIWWWRASRVLQDYDLVGNSKEVIDEFPFFSLFLADLHPHILAMPFVFLACALGLELFYLARSGTSFSTGLFGYFQNIFLGFQPGKKSSADQFKPLHFWGAGLVLGGLAFLNTWDFPIYVGLISAAIVLGRYLEHGWEKRRIFEFLEIGISLGLAGIVLFIPFYAGFSSQAGGLLPSLAFFTRGAHFWIMFGVLLVPIFIGLIVAHKKHLNRQILISGFRNSIFVILGFWIAMLLLGMILILVPGMLGSLNVKLEALLNSAAGQFYNLQGSASLRDLLLVTSLKRLLSPGGWLTITVLLGLLWAGVLHFRQNHQANESGSGKESTFEISPPASSSYPFVLLLIAFGTALTLFPEFFYLRDQFGWRMNTIFKFYYQTWILWSMAAAVSCFFIWKNSGRNFRWVASGLIMLGIFAGLIYPYFGMYFRFSSLGGQTLTLDGNAHIANGNPDEVAAIEYLKAAPVGIIAEAIGGSYSGYGRISTQTGLVTVLGWPGHESQWRGGAKEIGSRENDVKLLYQTKDWKEALQILQKYQIRYIYIGGLEHNLYGINETKFQTYLIPAFHNKSVVIYEVPDHLLMTNIAQ